MNTRNLFLFVLDSCRFDTFKTASENINSGFDLKTQKAFAPASWTLPAHVSFVKGFLPETIERLPYYNRFQQQLFRFSSDKYLDFNKQRAKYVLKGNSIFNGLSEFGFNSILYNSIDWLSDSSFKRYFDRCHPIKNCENQISHFLDNYSTHKSAVLFNFGETHFPYNNSNIHYKDVANIRNYVRNFKPGHNSKEIDMELMQELKLRQEKSAEFILQKISEMLKKTKSYTAIITADHGECFGEDYLFGHGFYHPKVFEVPLLIIERK